MAQTYENGSITLKIQSLVKRKHDFIDSDGSKKAGLIVSKGTNSINILLNADIDDEVLLKNIFDSYNQFIDKNQRYKNYSLSITQPKRIFDISSIKKHREQDFNVYAIKKDADSSIKIVTKEQIDQLDKNKIPYLLYLNPYHGFNTIYGEQRKCFITSHVAFNIEKPDDFKDSKFLVDISNHGRKRHHIGMDHTYSISMFIRPDLSKTTPDDYISVPDLEAINVASSATGVLHLSDQPQSTHNEPCNIPLDLSNVDIKQFNSIVLNYKLDKENLEKTLKTIKGQIPDITIEEKTNDLLDFKLEPKEVMPYSSHLDDMVKYDGEKLLSKLLEHKNELTNG